MKDHMHFGRPRPSDGTDRTMGPPAVPSGSGTASPTMGEKQPRMMRFESSPALVEPTHSKDSTSGTYVHNTTKSNTFLHQANLSVAEVFQNLTGAVSEVEGRVFVHQFQPLVCIRLNAGRPNNGTHLDPPVRLLSRCHTLSVTMATLGFTMALLGILVFAWTTLPLGVSIFASVCLGGCLLPIFFVMSVHF